MLHRSGVRRWAGVRCTAEPQHVPRSCSEAAGPPHNGDPRSKPPLLQSSRTSAAGLFVIPLSLVFPACGSSPLQASLLRTAHGHAGPDQAVADAAPAAGVSRQDRGDLRHAAHACGVHRGQRLQGVQNSWLLWLLPSAACHAQVGAINAFAQHHPPAHQTQLLAHMPAAHARLLTG